jgi:Flp pilus assembly CpaE family ATPase
MILEPVVQSVAYARHALASLRQNDIAPQDVFFAVNNRERSELKISWMDVQKAIGFPIVANIIPVPELVHQARQRKKLPAEIDPNSLFVKQLQKVLAAVFPGEEQNA